MQVVGVVSTATWTTPRPLTVINLSSQNVMSILLTPTSSPPDSSLHGQGELTTQTHWLETYMGVQNEGVSGFVG